MQFQSYLVVPMRDLGEHCEPCPPQNADFWGLYGVGEDECAYAIGDFSTQNEVEFIRGALETS